MSATMPGHANIPWEPRPANSFDVVWRYSANPVIPRNLIPDSNSIFNSAVWRMPADLAAYSAATTSAAK